MFGVERFIIYKGFRRKELAHRFLLYMKYPRKKLVIELLLLK